MKNFRILCAMLGAGATLYLCSDASALPVMDVQVEVLMAQADDLAQTLKLNNNQQILWRQTETKMRAIFDDRRRRRDRLQSDMKSGLDNPNTELRDLAKSYDAESDLSYREDKQLRELFLTVNDALDDKQRQAVLRALNDQLQRVADRSNEPPKENDQPRSRGIGRQKPGGGPPQQ